MSSAEAPRSGESAPKIYFCHQCDGTVSISLSSSPNLVCPQCNGGFIEEYENPSPSPSSLLSSLSSSQFGVSALPLVFPPASGSLDLRQLLSDSSLHRSSSSLRPDTFNPFLFLQNHLHPLMAGGANIQIVLESGSEASGTATAFRLPADLGDYFLGPGLEQLIQQLAENDPNRYGTPPASKTAIESLPSVKVSEQLLNSDSAQCAVCMDAFDVGADVKQMPCKHIYHPDCILPWLERHNSCPVCRYELPTDDPEYEHQMRETPLTPPNSAASGSDSSGGGGQGGSGEMRTAERRFRISLGWPFRVPLEEARNDNPRNDEERNLNSGSQGSNQNSGWETRQEDLD